MKTGNQPPAILFCIGTEKWLREQTIRHLKERWIAPGFEEMDMVVFSEPPDDHRVVLQAVRTLPFGSPARLVVIEGLSQISLEDFPWLADLRSHPPSKSCLLLCAERMGKDAGGIQVVWCQPLKGKELRDWILTQAKIIGALIEPAAVALLVNRVGEGLQSLALALESLALLVGAEGRITVADVEALIAPSARETAFDILDRAASGHPDLAMGQLRQSITQGQLTAEQLMGALGWYYRMIWKTRDGNRGSSWVSPQRQAAMARLMRWPGARLQAAMEEVLKADVDLKLGHPAPELLADQLLLRLSG